MFGDVLMLAGLTRIIEICFLPSLEKDSAPFSDRNSETTVAVTPGSEEYSAVKSASQAFRHLPPFVSMNYRIDTLVYLSLLVVIGRCRVNFVNKNQCRFLLTLHLIRLLFMSATDAELNFVNDEGMDHVTYVLIMLR